jgi:uncharacterized membrane protein HdeD (DUF308 family)
MLIALVRNWWMMAVRGSLALAFGLVLLLSPVLQLDRVVGLFGAYAVLDGIWSLAAARRASKSVVAVWPIALGAVVSIAIGILAIGWPFVPARVVQLLAGWGLIVGGLEVVAGLLVFFVASVFRRDMGKGTAALP